MVFLSMAIVSVLVFVVAGLEHSVYQKNHPFIPDFYTAKEKAEFEEKFPRRAASGIGLMFLYGLTPNRYPRLAAVQICCTVAGQYFWL